MPVDFFERWPDEEPARKRLNISAQDRFVIKGMAAIFAGASGLGVVLHLGTLNFIAAGVLLLVAAAFVTLWQWVDDH